MPNYRVTRTEFHESVFVVQVDDAREARTLVSQGTLADVINQRGVCQIAARRSTPRAVVDGILRGDGALELLNPPDPVLDTVSSQLRWYGDWDGLADLVAELVAAGRLANIELRNLKQQVGARPGGSVDRAQRDLELVLSKFPSPAATPEVVDG